MSYYEQCENIKFCIKSGTPANETFQMIKQVYSKEDCVAVFCLTRFVQGKDSFEDDEHTGQPQTVRAELKIQDVATVVHPDHSQMGT
jgi:hypothetical protein